MKNSTKIGIGLALTGAAAVGVGTQMDNSPEHASHPNAIEATSTPTPTIEATPSATASPSHIPETVTSPEATTQPPKKIVVNTIGAKACEIILNIREDAEPPYDESNPDRQDIPVDQVQKLNQEVPELKTELDHEKADGTHTEKSMSEGYDVVNAYGTFKENGGSDQDAIKLRAEAAEALEMCAPPYNEYNS